MAVFEVGDFTVYPGITGRVGDWRAHFSITTPDGRGSEHRFPVRDVPGSFETEGEAMEAARIAGREAATQLAEQARMEPYRDGD